MGNNQNLNPRDVVKLAFQYQETDYIPYYFEISLDQERSLSEYYGEYLTGGNELWRSRIIKYIGQITGVDQYLSLAGLIPQEDGSERDSFGCSYKGDIKNRMGSIFHLVDWPLHEPKMGKYHLPDLKSYFDNYVIPRWPFDIRNTENQFRIIYNNFGLFERAWSLRSFEEFLIDMAINEKFVKELLEHITQWYLQCIDLMAAAPVDAILLSDDHSGQRGLLMGEERWRKLLKPRWKQVYERIHHYGFYTIMHMCGDISTVIPDLIEIGLDCMESCQPEAMDIYKLKKEYGKDIRFWGGLGVQSLYSFGTPDEIRYEIRRLKREMGRGGGYILSSAKPPSAEVPAANIAALLEEMMLPRP